MADAAMTHETIDGRDDGVTTTNPPIEKRKTGGATKTRMAGHEGASLHYKHVRTTITLLIASTVFREFTPREQDAFRVIVKRNFDLSSAGDEDLEYVFAKLDNETMDRVRSEFEFVPRVGNIRNHGACVAVCALCGKGDSKDDGTNRDKLQYDFRLANTAGGDDLWVGSNCIVNFGLKVRGAETSEEAKAILDRQLRECISLWKKEAWRAEHADHMDIPRHYEQLAKLTQEFKYYGFYGRRSREIELLGQDQERIFRQLQFLLRGMRNAMRFYQRASYLTPVKEEVWRKTKAMLWSLSWLTRTLDASRDFYGDRRDSYLISERRKREERIRRLRTEKKPRAMP